MITSSLWGWTVQPQQRLTYEELNNTGKLVIIQNIELRSSITTLYARIEVMEGTALARTGEYARLVYSILPRKNERELKQGLSSNEQKMLTEAILSSDLEQHITFEQNRAQYMRGIWRRLKDEIEKVNTRIVAELNE